MRDAIIVGAGLAGLTCAWRLADALPSARILVLEQAQPGGSSALAVGSFTAAGTSLQRQAGIEDSPAEHYEDLLEIVELEGTPDDAHRYRGLLRRFCEDAPAALEQLRECGVRFAGPHLEPPHRKPRMHNAVPAARAAVEALLEAVAARPNVELASERPVTALEREGAGFRAIFEGGAESCAALVLACGDRSAAWSQVPGLNPNALGRPIELAARGFGCRQHPTRYRPGLRTVVAGKPQVEPVPELVAASVAELGDGCLPGRHLLESLPELGGREVRLELQARLRDDRACTYPGIGYASLGRLVEEGLAVERGGMIELGPLRVVITLADGALDVDACAAVLDESLEPVPGLFACGSAALGGIQLNGHGHHLMWAAVSGSWAARSAAEVVA